ncbi:SRPBCC family protein [Streptomyces roseoverticillatus]|uniref:SRPBCC family protein n=1 Tax=Streptomyces roseoverticillatus TaxID=66429 RepID=UPI001F3C3083|nr:SRPBCC family protein [Streptomyces roseoverticillatus]MCF3105133.1 SRPBCC family protein [Streptomyces roseoverticillatus]
MTPPATTGAPAILRVRARVLIAAAPDTVYDTVSDLTRSGEWSRECTGGRWVSGTPRTVGAVFRGENYRGADVVPWAPVVRGPWTTESEVVAAEPWRLFQWVVRDSAGLRQDSTWTYELEAAAEGCLLVHHYRLGRPTEGLAKIFEQLGEDGRRRFTAAWNEKLADDVAASLSRIKRVVECGVERGAGRGSGFGAAERGGLG